MDSFFSSTEINAKMRGILVDWIVVVSKKFKLKDHTLHLCIMLIDKFCISNPNYVKKKNFQLVGITCLMIACKIEELYSPEVQDFVYISDKAFSGKEVLECERVILKTLNYDVMIDNMMTTYDSFIDNDIKTKYYMDLSLLDSSIVHNFNLHEIVESCMELTHNRGSFWSECMEKIQHFEQNNTFKEVKNKYSN